VRGIPLLACKPGQFGRTAANKEQPSAGEAHVHRVVGVVGPVVNHQPFHGIAVHPSGGNQAVY
jgi:hypothetical protein